jgi:ABC-type multidrug transport system ATPase subunit
MPSDNSVIKVQGLEKVFPGGVRAVDSVSFEVREGEVFGFRRSWDQTS